MLLVFSNSGPILMLINLFNFTVNQPSVTLLNRNFFNKNRRI